MRIKSEHHDVKTADGTTMRIFVFSPNMPDYPHAKWPGVVCFSEIYQVTGPVERFASNIASQGYVVACPSSFHEWEGPEAIPYDVEGTDRGNRYKAEKRLTAYDEDSTLTVDHLLSRKDCTGRIASTGMCLGGHLALRCALDPRVLSAFCYFATDVHSASLGGPGPDDTLVRIAKGDLGEAEVTLAFGRQDTHVPLEGRTLIRQKLEEGGTLYNFMEVQGQHAWIRDTSSKGRWDAALSRAQFTLMMELFDRTVARDLGSRVGSGAKVEHVC